jgi:hypothetical protein
MRKRVTLSIATTIVCLWCAPEVYGQTTDETTGIYSNNEPAIEAKRGKILHAFRVTSDTPRIDGRLDDAAWERAQRSENFVQWEPDNMAPLSERTVVQVAYDDRFLYVALRCYDRMPDLIAAGLGRRDEFPPTDQAGVGFDPRHDHLTGYVFFTNPSGVQSDLIFFDDEKIDRDYDSVWEVRAQIDEAGWTAEYRIPFSQMRFNVPPAPRTVWGFGSRRTIRRRGETGEWTGRPRGERGEVSRWGHLVFDEPLEPPRRIELLPYSLARAERLRGVNDTGGGAAAGLDARVGLGSAFTMSATVNPDFGQVEQDPAVLNLTVFETFFPEKRPFFLEDSRTFVPPPQLFQLFHSRRIGRVPDRIPVPSSDVVIDRPDQTTILGAAKLTGKASGWPFGALSAATASEYADISGRDRRLIEPLTSYNVVRVQRDFRGSSNVGALATAAVRDTVADAYTGGVDYNIRWDRNRGSWDGAWAVTRAPSASGVAATGFGGLMNAGITRKHASVFANVDHLSPTFRVTDLGFLRTRVNRTHVTG